MERTLWNSQAEKVITYPSLTQDIEVDVAIIGGGITGVTAAHHLIQQGKKVAIIEAYQMGGVTTSSSTGNLYVPVQPYYQNILSKFNQETVTAIALSRQFAIDYIEKIIQEKNIQCAFARRPWFLYSNDQHKISFLEKEAEVIKKTGISVNFTQDLPLPFKFKKAITMENQARFNPYSYVTALANDLHRRGCEIFEDTRIVKVEEKDNRCIFQGENGKIIAKNGIIATHTPIGVNLIQFFTGAYRSYGVAVHLQDNLYPEGHFWDLDESHHATCTHTVSAMKPDMLIVAGNHHKTGQDPDAKTRFQQLEKFLKDHFKVSETVFRWSAQHYHAADDVPYIGLSHGSKNIYLATGFFADGLVYGTLAGIIIGDAITHKNNNWAEIYRSTRLTPIASASFVLKESLDILTQYMKDWPIIEKHPDLKINEAKVIEINGEKCGVYRDEHNQIHRVSAVCTHMKCIVNWNNAEKTWDCPCHGSRFTFKGEVIEGPAQRNLAIK